jgi:pyruvate/2-oxoglutarate dehydrogenase complex dihydrolipoamide acyltransferase (E2) component
MGRAIQADLRVQAIRDVRGRLAVFPAADIVTLVEPEAGQVAIPHIIRDAGRKTVLEISDEIRAVQARPGSSPQGGGLVSLGARLPRFARMLFFRILKKSPRWYQRIEGTAVITSVGMFGKGGGWGLGFLPVHTLGLTVGGIASKPGVHEGAIQLREYLHLTISFDHDIVDGAPAARFSRRLVDEIESAAVILDPIS